MMRWLPEDVSTYGHEIDSLFYLIYYITAATFVLVTVLMIWFLIKYREQPGRRAVYNHGNTSLEIIWTVIPAAILIVLSFMSVNTWAKIKRNIPASDFEIQVTAKQFNWDVVYPGADGKLNYLADESGNKIIDASHAGYGGGGIAIPTLPVRESLWPVAARGALF